MGTRCASFRENKTHDPGHRNQPRDLARLEDDTASFKRAERTCDEAYGKGTYEKRGPILLACTAHEKVVNLDRMIFGNTRAGEHLLGAKDMTIANGIVSTDKRFDVRFDLVDRKLLAVVIENSPSVAAIGRF